VRSPLCSRSMIKQSPKISGPVARLAQSRAQLTSLLGPESTERPRMLARTDGGAFPRSVTMRFLCSGRTREAAGLLVLGLLSRSRPRTLRWLRFLPVTSVTRLLIRGFARKAARRRSDGQSSFE
jgi:hypothetical protein